MENLLIIALATSFVSSIVVEQKVLSPLRVRWQGFLMFKGGFAEWLLELLGCRVCFGFWAGQLVALATIGSLYDGWTFELHLVGFAAGGLHLAWLEYLASIRRPPVPRVSPVMPRAVAPTTKDLESTLTGLLAEVVVEPSTDQ